MESFLLSRLPGLSLGPGDIDVITPLLGFELNDLLMLDRRPEMVADPLSRNEDLPRLLWLSPLLSLHRVSLPLISLPPLISLARRDTFVIESEPSLVSLTRAETAVFGFAFSCHTSFSPSRLLGFSSSPSIDLESSSALWSPPSPFTSSMVPAMAFSCRSKSSMSLSPLI